MKENYLAFVGPRTIDAMQSYYADKAIVSCKGLDMQKGISDANEMFCQVKEEMLRSASQRILIADHTKFGKVAFSVISDWSSIDMVVTDIRPSDEWLKYFAEKGIQCLYGKEDDEDDSICE